MRPGSAPWVVRRPLGWDLAPVEVLRLVRSDAHPVALFGAWAGGADVISSEPVRVRSPPQSLADVLDSPCAPDAVPGDVGHARQLRAGLADPVGSGFGGGWIGYLGFGFGGEVLPVPPAPPPAPAPAAQGASRTSARDWGGLRTSAGSELITSTPSAQAPRSATGCASDRTSRRTSTGARSQPSGRHATREAEPGRTLPPRQSTTISRQ